MSTGNRNPGNFANNREKASQAGKKGGQSSPHSSVAQDRQKAPESGRKGGQGRERSDRQS